MLSVLQDSYLRVGKPESIAVAVSGGADSVALLFSLKKLSETHPIKLYCCHVNHGLRAQSDEEAFYVKTLCADWNIPYFQRSLELHVAANIEENARNARYAALWDMAKTVGAKIIATGHHQEDQAETVLMHLMYGAGGRGLSGMKEFNLGIWRPFLSIAKYNLVALLREHDISWREDESNQNNDFTRNAIRNSLMPRMDALYPGVSGKITQTASILQAQEDMLDSHVAKWLDTHAFMCGDLCWCNKKALVVEHIAMQRKIVRKLAEYFRVTLNFTQVEHVLQAAYPDAISKTNLPLEHWAYSTHTKLHILPPRALQWPLGNIKFSYPAYELGDGLFTQAFDADMIQGAVLRTRQAGDIIQPIGQKGTQSLKQYMVDRKVDQPFRDIWPVLAIDNHVLWVIGYGVSQLGAITARTTNTVFACYTDTLPDKRFGRNHYGPDI